jgi:hypothetical protein
LKTGKRWKKGNDSRAAGKSKRHERNEVEVRRIIWGKYKVCELVEFEVRLSDGEEKKESYINTRIRVRMENRGGIRGRIWK